jgi:diguanylate cyclase (GGDEF)-like protein
MATQVAGVQSLAALPTLVSAALLPGSSPWDLTALALMGAVLVALGAALLWIREAPWPVLRLTPYSGMAVITAGVAVNEPLAGTGFFYLWPAVYAGLFLSRRDLAGLLCAMAAAYGTALWLWSEEALRISDFTTVMVPVVVASAAVAHLRGRVLRLVTELRERLEELREAATHDPLTGLLNRRAFDALLAREVDRARAAGLRLSVVMFDMDHFKRINDRFGHAAGDDALRRFAATLRQGRRSDDVAARLGGEEFSLVLVGAGPDQAALVAAAVVARLADASAEHPTALSVSAGIASLDHEVATPDDLLLAADRALYAAKAAGRGQVAMWGRPIRIGTSDTADASRLSASSA